MVSYLYDKFVDLRYFSDLTGEIHGEGSGLSDMAIDSLVMARSPSGFDSRLLFQELSIPGL